MHHFEEELWFDVKRAKSRHLLQLIKPREENGDIAKTNRRPHILANFLQNVQWDEVKVTTESEQHQWPNENVLEETANVNISAFNVKEIERFLKKAKNNKSPGPDGIPMEFY